MAYDIGPKIGIDGEAEFRKSIQMINTNIKTLGSEMKVVTAEFEENADGMEALAAKADVLERTYDEQSKHLEKVRDMLQKSKDLYGDNAQETQKWQRVVNESAAALKKTENELKRTKDTMEKLEDGTEEAGDAFDDLGDAAGKVGKNFNKFEVAAGNLISGVISGMAGAIKDVAGEIFNLDEATEEYRVAQGKLKTAFEVSGYSMHAAKTAYRDLYAIMGDTDSATEAAQLMAKLSESEEDLSQWTTIAAGVMGTFGDALPIEGLIEAANETAKTGKLTGQLADALNWAGIAEEDFQKQLDAAGSESERNRLIMETLAGAYDDASNAFYRNNEELIRTRENQAKLDEVSAKLGETVSDVKNAFVEQFGPAITDAAENVADFIQGVDTDALFEKFEWAFGAIQDVWDEADDYFDDVADIIGGAFTGLQGLWEGDFQKAADGARRIIDGLKGAVQEASQDFDRWLNKAWDSTVAYEWQYSNGQYVKVPRGTMEANQQATQEKSDVYMDGVKVGSLVTNRQSNASIARGNNLLLK